MTMNRRVLLGAAAAAATAAGAGSALAQATAPAQPSPPKAAQDMPDLPTVTAPGYDAPTAVRAR